jgi:NAD(P)-dependent dehydrogenase (short-subunit alcohol dehydrogenase family)
MSILDDFRLDDQAAIVTGASSGLGIEFAKALSESGAAVLLAARRTDRLDSVAAEIRAAGGKALSVYTDVTDPDSCKALAETAMAEFGKIDILVNNAGKGTAVPATRETPEQFRSVIDINLNGSYWMAQACAKSMGPGSSIVNVSSVLALTTVGLPQAAYTSSKAAIMGLTRDLAGQWTGRKGIRVNAIAPGYFPTEMTDELKPGFLDGMIRDRMLIPRLGMLRECAATLIWLASPAAGYVTGQTIVVDGGVSIT